MLNIKNLSKHYADFQLFIDDLTIHTGETIALVGNNGAGKTTLLRCILNLINIEKGDIEIFGHNVRTTEKWKKYTNSYLDDRFLIDFLTPKEFFSFTLEAFGEHEIKDKWKDFLPLKYSQKYIRDLSTGNKQKVGILSATITNPRLLILDEPFANLDPGSRAMLSDLLKKEDQIQIISSHDLTEVVEIADRVILMENGLIIKDELCNESTIDQLKKYFQQSKDRTN